MNRERCRAMSGRTFALANGGRPVADVRRALGAAGFELGPTRPDRRTLLETFDGRMASAGLRLEHRDDQVLVLSDRRSAVQLAATRSPRFATELAGGPFRARVAAATRRPGAAAAAPATTRRPVGWSPCSTVWD